MNTQEILNPIVEMNNARIALLGFAVGYAERMTRKQAAANGVNAWRTRLDLYQSEIVRSNQIGYYLNEAIHAKDDTSILELVNIAITLADESQLKDQNQKDWWRITRESKSKTLKTLKKMDGVA